MKSPGESSMETLCLVKSEVIMKLT